MCLDAKGERVTAPHTSISMDHQERSNVNGGTLQRYMREAAGRVLAAGAHSVGQSAGLQMKLSAVSVPITQLSTSGISPY